MMLNIEGSILEDGLPHTKLDKPYKLFKPTYTALRSDNIIGTCKFELPCQITTLYYVFLNSVFFF